MAGAPFPMKRVVSPEESTQSSSPAWANTPMVTKSAPFAEASVVQSNSKVRGSLEDDVVVNMEPERRSLEGEEFGRDDSVLDSSGSSLSEDFTADFFKPLQEPNEEDRAEALKFIIQLLTDSLHSPSKDLVKAQLRRIVRFAYQVPFKDIALAFQRFLELVKEEGSLPVNFTVPNPSAFIPAKHFPPMIEADEQRLKIFRDVFLQSGRVSSLVRVLALHPTYFTRYYAAFNFIMRDDSPLPYHWRNYIAILTASRSKCQWLVMRQEEEFVLNGGDPRWLGGYVNAPKKLVNLMDVIVMLCHQPWLLTKSHVAALVKGTDSWSMGELVHAMLIICTFNALSGIVYGCGVAAEVDLEQAPLTADDPEEEEIKEGRVIEDTNKVAELLKSGFNAEPEEQQVQLFVKAETTDCSESHSPHVNLKLAKNCGRYLGDFNLQHVDFDVHSKTYSIFKVQDYCWKEDGFELVRRFLPGGATLLDDTFDHIYTMTYKMFNRSTDVDTLPFRRAIWQYVQRVKGMFHDDYNYQEVNMFLNRATKAYVKKIVCFPETITKNDYNNVGLALQPDEKVHVALLAVESAKQSTLLYGIHAIMQHITSV